MSIQKKCGHIRPNFKLILFLIKNNNLAKLFYNAYVSYNVKCMVFQNGKQICAKCLWANQIVVLNYYYIDI